MSISILDLRDSIRDKILPFYIICGNDYYFRRQALDELLALVSPEMSDFNVTYMPSDSSVDSVIMATNTSPLMDNYRIVVWQGDIRKPNKDQIKDMESGLARYMQSPCSDVILVAVDEADYFKSVYKLGEVIDCNTLDTSRLVSYVHVYISDRGYTIDAQLIRELVLRCNNEMSSIVGELEKLFAYSDGGDIDIVAMDDVVTHNVEQDVFKLTDAISRENVDEAYILLDTLLTRGEEPLKLLGLILAQFKRMFIVRVSKDSDEVLAKKLGVKSYAIKVARSVGSKYKPMALKRIVEDLQNTEYDIKSGRIGINDGLQLAMARVTARRK